MASSGSKSVAVTAYDTLTFNWSISSQSVANNTSNLAWSLVLTSVTNGKIISSASKTWSVTVNGTTYSGTNTVGIADNATLTLASGSTAIAHNSDGTKSFSYSFSQEFAITFGGVYIGTASGSGTGTLTAIARASSITSAANVTMGSACSVQWTPASSGFTYTLKFVCGSGSYTTGTISPGSTSAYTYTGYAFPTATWAPYVTSATSATVTATLTTYSGSASVGTATKTFTLTVPTSVVPTVSISVEQAKTYISGKWLAGYSKPKVTITSSGTYSSTISAVKTTFNSKSSANTGSVTFSAPSSSGSYTVSTTVTDSRGRTATASTTLAYVAYTAPQITGVSLIRASDTAGTADAAAGGYGYLKFGYTITSVSSTNTINVTAKYKAKTATSYTSLASYTSTYTRTGLTNSFTADTGKSYDVVITAADAVTSVTKSLTLPTAETLLHFGADGKSLGIGKVAEGTNLVDSAWDMQMPNLAVSETVTCGGTLDAGDNITVTQSYDPKVTVTNGDRSIALHIGTGGVNRGIYDNAEDTWLIYRGASGMEIPDPLTVGGTLDAGGNITVTKSSAPKVNVTNNDQSIALHIGGGGTNRGIYDNVLADWLVYYNGTNLATPNNLIVAGHSTSIGSLLSSTSIVTSSLTANTSVQVATLTVPIGSWVITGQYVLASTSSGTSNGFASISTSSSSSNNACIQSWYASSGNTTRCECVYLVNITSATTYYLIAYSTLARTVSSVCLRAIRIA